MIWENIVKAVWNVMGVYAETQYPDRALRAWETLLSVITTNGKKYV